MAYDQYGLAFSGHVWTGSNSDGSAAQPVGSGQSVTTGWNVGVNRGWMYGDTRPPYYALPVYALSSVLTAGVTVTTPSAPAGVSGTPGDKSVSLSWTAPVSNGGAAISDYIIQYRSDSASTWTTFSDGVSTATRSTVTGLTNGTSYVFRVAPANVAGVGEYSSASLPVSPVAPWIRQVGGLGNDTGSAVSAFADGSVLLAGASSDAAWFGPIKLEGSSRFVAKIDPRGNFAWATKLPGATLGACTFSDGSAMVTGWFEGTATVGSTTLTAVGAHDIYVAKLNAGGDVMWVTRAGGVDVDGGTSISALSDGSAIFGGFFNRSLTLGSTTLTAEDNDLGGSSLFVAKITANGTFVWARGLGATWQSTTFPYVSTLVDGSSFVSGTLDVAKKFGSTTLAPGGYFVSKIDAGGSFVWAKKVAAVVRSHVALADGSCVVAGSLNGTASFGPTTLTTNETQPFVAKLDASGNYVWAKTLRITGASGGGNGLGISKGPDGSLVVTGSVSQTTDEFVTKLDKDGNAVWRVLGVGMHNGGYDSPNNVATLADGSAIVMGNFASARFGATTLTSYGQTDVVVAKLDPQGNWGSAPCPLAPTNISAVAGNGIAALYWRAPANNGGSPITDYVIQYSSNGGSTWTTFSDGVNTATQATVTGLSNGVAYVFRVSAVNAAGLGTRSANTGLITPRTVPSIPLNVVGTPANSRVGLTWSVPTSNGGSPISDYVIQYSSNGGSTWQTFSDGVSTATQATVTGLTNGVAYVFRVSAINAAGLGSWSAVSASLRPQSLSVSIGISPISIPGRRA